jgi:replicative DNA helicase
VLQKLPIYIDDSAVQKVRTIAATARRLKRKHGLALVIIDYLQLIEPRDYKAPREQQVAQVSKSLKALAKELSTPVLVLAQLNREVEKRTDKTPQLSDLRESGSVEQDADVVMFLHRPSAYDPDQRPGECDVVVRKNRRGNVGKATLAWLAHSTKFADLEIEDQYDRASRAFQGHREW